MSNEETGVGGPEKYIKTTILQVSFSRIHSNIFFNFPLLYPFPFQVQTYLDSVLECTTQITGHLEFPGPSSTQHPFSHACWLSLPLFCPRLNLTKSHLKGNTFSISIPISCASPATPNVGLLKTTKIYD